LTCYEHARPCAIIGHRDGFGVAGIGNYSFHFPGAKIASRRPGVPSTLSKCGYRSPPW
jgi:hypothetical protein